MNLPTIKITGATASGKSCLAFAIKNALESYGIKSEITGDEDEMPGVMEAEWKQRLTGLLGESITIETERTRFISTAES